MIDELWQDDWDKNGFQSSFFKALNERDISMMQYLAQNPKFVPNFGKTKWTASHTIAFGVCDDRMNSATRKDVLKQFFDQQKQNQFEFSRCGYLPIHLACKTNNVTVLQLIIDTIDKKDLTKLINHVTKDKYWKFTPLMIAIENNSIDCAKMLCNYNKTDLLKIKSRYPNYNSLQFACHYNNIDILKIMVNKIIKLDGNTIFTRKMIGEMIKMVKHGQSQNIINRGGSSHAYEECIEYISYIPNSNNQKVGVSTTTIAIQDTGNDSDEKGFDVRASRRKIAQIGNDTCRCCHSQLFLYFGRKK